MKSWVAWLAVFALAVGIICGFVLHRGRPLSSNEGNKADTTAPILTGVAQDPSPPDALNFQPIPAPATIAKPEANYRGQPAKAWIGGLLDRDESTREASAFALSQISPDTAEDLPALLIPALGDANIRVRLYAAVAVSKLSKTDDIAMMLAAIATEDTNFDERTMAINAIAGMGTASHVALPKLQRLYDEEVRTNKDWERIGNSVHQNWKEFPTDTPSGRYLMALKKAIAVAS